MTQTPAATPAPSTAEEALATAADDASLARSIARSAQIEADLDVNPGRYRMLTGVRPTGNMHLGHYFGTMHSWRSIQDHGVNTEYELLKRQGIRVQLYISCHFFGIQDQLIIVGT